MKLIKLYSLILIFLLVIVSGEVFSQDVSIPLTYKLGPHHSATHRFEELRLKDYGYKDFHHFKPKKKKTKGYYDNGKVFFLGENEVVELMGLYRGEYDGKKGLWMSPYKHIFGYIFIGDLVDAEKEATATENEKMKIAVEHDKQIELNKKKSIPYWIFSLVYLAFLGYLTIKLGKGSDSGSDSTTFTRTGETDSFGRDTFTQGPSGDLSGLKVFLLLIASVSINFILSLQFQTNDPMGSSMFLFLAIASFVEIAVLLIILRFL